MYHPRYSAKTLVNSDATTKIGTEEGRFDIFSTGAPTLRFTGASILRRCMSWLDSLTGRMIA